MSPEVQAKAFEPFFTTKEPGKGTGLGLSQLYGFAKQSGGTARIESIEGQGTTVSIYLPRTSQALDAKPELVEPRLRDRLSVLLVDDDDSVRTVAAAMLGEIGCDVECAASGAEALAMLDSRSFSLVLTDVAMPGMTGIELASAARQRAHGMPILFATGYADLQAFGEELAEEIVLKKPYRLADLAAKVETARLQRPSGKVIPLKARS
jgi:CheY-like chemotaxis protein